MAPLEYLVYAVTRICGVVWSGVKDAGAVDEAGQGAYVPVEGGIAHAQSSLGIGVYPVAVCYVPAPRVAQRSARIPNRVALAYALGNHWLADILHCVRHQRAVGYALPQSSVPGAQPQAGAGC